MEKTPSLETCKKLKEAGFVFSTEKVWPEDSSVPIYRHDVGMFCAMFPSYEGEFFDAPDMFELWLALPEHVYHDQEYWYLGISKFTCFFEDYGSFLEVEETKIRKDNPAEALANLWLWVKENHPEAL